MNELLIETMKYVGSYFAIIVILFLAVNFLSKGWLKKFLIVKISRGKKVLINCDGLTGRRAQTGKYDGGTIKFKGNDKKDHVVSDLAKGDLYHYMGVWSLDFDLVKEKVIKRDGIYKQGQDTAKVANLIDRALYSPNIEDNKEKLKWVLWIGAAILAAIAAYLAFKNGEAIQAFQTVQGVIQ